jgi:hypothetical protein
VSYGVWVLGPEAGKGEANFQAPRLPCQPPPEAKMSSALYTTIIITIGFWKFL